jgi:hypothetical protein
MVNDAAVLRAQMYINELEHTLTALQLAAASADYDSRVYGLPSQNTSELIKRCARILFVKAKFNPTRDMLTMVMMSNTPLATVKDKQAEYYRVIKRAA